MSLAVKCSPKASGESEVAHQRRLGEAVLHTCHAGLITNQSVFSGCIHYHQPGPQKVRLVSCRMANPKIMAAQEDSNDFESH